eukprot:6206731-Pleurochrysis_carterae.AAC.4
MNRLAVERLALVVGVREHACTVPPVGHVARALRAVGVGVADGQDEHGTDDDLAREVEAGALGRQRLLHDALLVSLRHSRRPSVHRSHSECRECID